MIVNETNSKIYETVFQQKALTEYILGITNHSFPFVIATYSATCTTPIDFTMFDKVICKLLQIEEVLSFEEMGEILGLNVVHHPEEGRYIDFGEKEILEEAIDSLYNSKMIEAGDSYYSRCRLTNTGREYAAKGVKFSPATQKEFEIFYDLTDGQHSQAEARFGNLIEIDSEYFDLFGDLIEVDSEDYDSIEFDFENETFVKEIAKFQVPHIYNPDKLRNFTDLKLIKRDTHTVDFSIVTLVSFIDKSVRYLAFDHEQNLHHPINKMIEANKNLASEILEQIIDGSRQISQNKKRQSQREYEEKAMTAQTEVDTLLSVGKSEAAIKKSKEFYSQSKMFEKNFVELNFEAFFKRNSTEYWMIIEQLNAHIFEKINIIIDKLKPSNNLIIVTQKNIQDDYKIHLSEVSENKPNLFFTLDEEIGSTVILSKDSKNEWAMLEEQIIIELQSESIEQFIEKKVFTKDLGWNNSIVKLYQKYRKSVASEYLKKAEVIVEKTFNELKQNLTNLSKNEIEELTLQSLRLDIFEDINELSETIKNFRLNSQTKIKTLEDLLNSKLESEFKRIEEEYQEEDTKFPISKLRDFEDKLLSLKERIFNPKSELAVKTNKLITDIRTKIKTLSNPPQKSKSRRKKPNRSSTKKR